jgi:uncharacterized protein YdeI (YjbR/CyaY-like superfamily)
MTLPVPSELAAVLDTDPQSKARFEAIPPSHRQEYINWVAEAKRADTRRRRAERVPGMLRHEV